MQASLKGVVEVFVELLVEVLECVDPVGLEVVVVAFVEVCVDPVDLEVVVVAFVEVGDWRIRLLELELDENGDDEESGDDVAVMKESEELMSNPAPVELGVGLVVVEDDEDAVDMEVRDWRSRLLEPELDEKGDDEESDDDVAVMKESEELMSNPASVELGVELVVVEDDEDAVDNLYISSRQFPPQDSKLSPAHTILQSVTGCIPLSALGVDPQ